MHVGLDGCLTLTLHLLLQLGEAPIPQPAQYMCRSPHGKQGAKSGNGTPPPSTTPLHSPAFTPHACDLKLRPACSQLLPLLFLPLLGAVEKVILYLLQQLLDALPQLAPVV